MKCIPTFLIILLFISCSSKNEDIQNKSYKMQGKNWHFKKKYGDTTLLIKYNHLHNNQGVNQSLFIYKDNDTLHEISDYFESRLSINTFNNLTDTSFIINFFNGYDGDIKITAGHFNSDFQSLDDSVTIIRRAGPNVNIPLKSGLIFNNYFRCMIMYEPQNPYNPYNEAYSFIEIQLEKN